MCGKLDYQKVKFDDYRRFSMPYQIFEDVHVISATCGINHFLMVSKQGRLWGMGENEYGCLGMIDTK